MMGSGPGYGSNWYGTMMSGNGGWLFPLIGLVALAAVIVLVVWAVRRH